MRESAERVICDKFRHLSRDKEWQSVPQEMLEQEVRKFDAVIFGGGPAGMSAALWCRELGLSSVLLEASNSLGGQLLRTFGAIRNHLGAEARNGREMADGFIGQLGSRDVEIIFDAGPKSIDWAHRRIVLSSGMQFMAHGLIIATGVSRRRLGVPGEGLFAGRGELDSGMRNAENVAGKSVVIVGGGDAALENAVILSKNAAKVTLVHRGETFRARREFFDQLAGARNVTIFSGTKVIALDGGERLETVTILSASQREFVIPADHILLRIGVEPNSSAFRDLVAVDSAGYIDVDRDGATSVPGIFAIGDVSHPNSPTISTAVGSGSAAAKALHAWLTGLQAI